MAVEKGGREVTSTCDAEGSLTALLVGTFGLAMGTISSGLAFNDARDSLTSLCPGSVFAGAVLAFQR